jgi:hypothetical protein
LGDLEGFVRKQIPDFWDQFIFMETIYKKIKKVGDIIALPDFLRFDRYYANIKTNTHPIFVTHICFYTMG